jgi:hypothetical protein
MCLLSSCLVLKACHFNAACIARPELSALSFHAASAVFSSVMCVAADALMLVVNCILVYATRHVFMQMMLPRRQHHSLIGLQKIWLQGDIYWCCAHHHGFLASAERQAIAEHYSGPNMCCCMVSVVHCAAQQFLRAGRKPTNAVKTIAAAGVVAPLC